MLTNRLRYIGSGKILLFFAIARLDIRNFLFNRLGFGKVKNRYKVSVWPTVNAREARPRSFAQANVAV